jgi:uncharacterized protein (TIGR02300 family)
VSKPEWGTKRVCPNCGTRYYDMWRDPIMCPKCGAPFDAESLAKTKKAARAVAPVAAEAEVVPLQDEELEADLAAEPDGEGEAITEIPAGEEAEGETEEEPEPATAGRGAGRGKVAEDETKKDGEEEDVLEDASELGEDEDDMAEVIENVDEDDDR